MEYVIPIIWFLAPLVVKLIVDVGKWKKGQAIDHRSEARWVAAAEGVAAVLFAMAAAERRNLGQLAVGMTVTIPMCWFFFVTFFDGFYNLIRRRILIKSYGLKGVGLNHRQYGFFGLGSKDKDDAFTDRFFRRLGDVWHPVFKIAGCIIFLTLYLILCN